jgi:multicomponent K+:H+ antiporter subunit D
VSATTLFIAFGLREPGMLAAGLYYLVHSTFVAAALFLVADLVRRGRGDASNDLRDIVPSPALRAQAGVMFLVAAVSIAGLPPLSGFVGKLAMLQSVPATQVAWVWPALLVSSMMVIVGLTRVGVRLFWKPHHQPVPAPAPAGRAVTARPTETAATALLLAYGVAMALQAAPLLRYADATAAQLLAPERYVEQLRATLPAMRKP